MVSVSTNKPKRTRLSAEKRRQQLVDYAIALTAKNGLGRARHSDIAESAGVAVSTVFFYFPTVELLNDAVINVVESRINNICLSGIDTNNISNTFSNLLNSYFEVFGQAIEGNRDYVSIFLEWGSAINSPHWQRYLKFRNNHIKYAKEVLKLAEKKGELKANSDIDALAIMISGVLRMMFKFQIYEGAEDATKEVYKSLLNHILKNPF